MKKLILLLSFVLTACGGGGGGSGGATQASTSYSTFAMGSKEAPWFASYIKSVDGSENLVLSSMDEGNAHAFTPSTPVHILKANDDGSVSDLSSTLFDKIPSYYWVRNIVPFIHPDTGTQALWFCNTGREVGDPNTVATIPRTPGIWGEQDGLFVMVNGKFVDKTDTLPQTVDFTHGCSAMKNHDGTTSLVKNTLGWLGPDAPQQSILSFNNGTWTSVFTSTWNLPGILTRGVESFFAIAGNFLKTNSDSAIFGRTMIRSNGTSFSVTDVLHAPDLESQGYTKIQGAVSGDVNNDGWDDLILVLSADGRILMPELSGAKLALFRNDGTGNLVYDPTAFIDYYDDSQFGLDIKIIDINFDGHPDIVTSGERYLYGTNLHYLKTDKVFVNNGSGKFNLKTIDDSRLNRKCKDTYCQVATWFLKGKDSNSYTLMSYSREYRDKTFYSQTITATAPLTLK